MKRTVKAVKVLTADEIIDNVEFIAREAARTAASVPMNNREYWALVGQDFMRFFSSNQFGSTAKYTWETRHVDQLNNLWIWRTR